MNFSRTRLGLALACATLIGLTACGGGGSSSVATTSTATAFSGTVATGAAMANASVSISCASGSGTATTTANGSYTTSLSDITLPCVLKATSSDGATVLYSVTTPTTTASSSQVANITPLTQLLVASLAGTDPATFFDSFSATTASSVTASSISAAQTAVLTTLSNAGLDVSSLSNLLTGTLVAATSSSSGNAYDVVLDALQAQLAASGTTLATLTTTVAAASPVASTTTATNTNAASLPAAQLLKTADSNCSALRSGDYWAITPTKGGDLTNQFASASYNASTKAATNLVGSSNVFSDNGTCQYLAADGVSNVVVSQAGIAVTRYLDGSSVSRLGLAIPKQTIAVSELAGTWSSLNFEMNDAGTSYVGTSATATVSSTGVLSDVTGCDGAVASSTCTAVTDAQSFQANSDGGFNLVDTTDNTTSRAFAYRAGNGSLIIVVVDGDGSMTFFTKQRTLSLPTVGTVNNSSWSVRTSNVLVANTLAVSYTTTITSVDSSASSYTRTQNTSTGAADYSETILINNPRNGYNFRAAASGVASTVSGTVNIRERTSMGLPGTGLSVQSIPSLTAFQVTVDQP